MVSKTILAMFAGQILLAFLLFYLLPISTATLDPEFNEPSRKIGKESRPIVTLSKGQVRGSLEKSNNGDLYAQFLGLRYARAPVGELRFARPKPVTKSWNGTVKEATKQAPKCVQFDKVSGEVVGKEDCLFVNIYVPMKCCAKEAVNCPVMTWLHPTSANLMRFQDASPANFGPQLFMDHRVVLVSVNYRLGPLGFLTMENDQAPGNLGLRDQALALEWIKAEAANFCGDPDKITVFGAGSGGTSALLQMISPLNKGKKLVQNVISQSGSLLKMDVSQAFMPSRKEFAESLARNVGCKSNTELLQCLKTKVDARTLVAKSLVNSSAWEPYVDGNSALKDPFLPLSPRTLIKQNKIDSHVKAVIIGHATEEGLVHMAPFIKNTALYANFSANLPSILFERKDVKGAHLKVAQLLKSAYVPEKMIFHGNSKQAVHMVSDLVSHGPVGLTVDLLAQHQPQLKVYFYHYKHLGSHSLCDAHVYQPWRFAFKLQLHNFGLGYNMRNGHGVCQGDELLSLFVLPDQPAPMNVGPISKPDKIFSKNMLHMWTNFAWVSQPTFQVDNCTAASEGCDGFHWEPVDPASCKAFASLKHPLKMTSDDTYWKRVEFYRAIHAAFVSGKSQEKSVRLELAKLGDSMRTHGLNAEIRAAAKMRKIPDDL